MREQRSARGRSVERARGAVGSVGGDFVRKMQEIRIASEYSLIRKLGEGGYSTVYLGP